MRTRTRIHPYVVPGIADRLAAYCGAKGLTESAAVEAAIEQYLEAGEKDNALILRRLDSLGRASAQHQRDLEVLSEAFAVFVYRWLGGLPELTPAEREVMNRLSSNRYQIFLGALAQNLARPARSFLTDAVRSAMDGTAQAVPPPSPSTRR